MSATPSDGINRFNVAAALLFALCRDSTEQVRIRRTVDAWIDTLSRDIQVSLEKKRQLSCPSVMICKQAHSSCYPQAEMSTEDAVTKHSVKRDTEASSARTGRGKPMSMLRGTGSKTAAGRRGRGRIAGSTRVSLAPSIGVVSEDSLMLCQ